LDKNITKFQNKIAESKDEFKITQTNKSRIDEECNEVKHKNMNLSDELDKMKFESQKQISK